MESVKITILYIFTLDFGEIINSYFFTKDQPFHVVLACPLRLFPWIDQAHVKKYQYTTREDLLHIIKETKPQLVIFSSGYLFQAFNLFSLSEFRKLISYVKECNIPYITTDPWMKIWTKYSISEICHSTSDLFKYGDLQKQLNHTFKNIYHLYPFPITKNQCLSFFNPRTVLTEVERNSHEALVREFFQDAGHYDVCSNKRSPSFNMFVLSDIDFKMFFIDPNKTQMNKLFIELSNRLSEIINNTSDLLVIVAPDQYCKSLKNQFSSHTHICCLSFCKFSLFYSLLMCANVVLYWNVFSASIMGRILNQLPVFFFSKGHMVTLCPKLYEHGVRFFYQNHPPFFVNPLSSLSANLFQEPLQQVKNTFLEISEYWRALKTPEEIILKLIEES